MCVAYRVAYLPTPARCLPVLGVHFVVDSEPLLVPFDLLIESA